MFIEGRNELINQNGHIFNLRNCILKKGKRGVIPPPSDDVRQARTSSMARYIEGGCESYLGFCKDKHYEVLNYM